MTQRVSLLQLLAAVLLFALGVGCIAKPMPPGGSAIVEGFAECAGESTGEAEQDDVQIDTALLVEPAMMVRRDAPEGPVGEATEAVLPERIRPPRTA
jgi:hypothetical protein